MTTRPQITNNRVEKLFEKCRQEDRAALVLFLTCGFPNIGTTRQVLSVLEEAGCDLLELGVPFSDPIADGPVIQKASTVALENGASFPQALDTLREFRASSQMPAILFGALNPYLARGLEKSARLAREAGADGILAADLPFEEAEEFRSILAKENLHLVTLLAPTSPLERIRMICESSTGFAYCIAYKGVTGQQDRKETANFQEDAAAYLARIRGQTDLPLALGFGIRTPINVRQAVDAGADAVVVGTALIQLIEEAVRTGKDIKKTTFDYVHSLHQELRRKPAV